jgi:thymidylate synthase
VSSAIAKHRNVNDALWSLTDLVKMGDGWRKIAPRGLPTMEWRGTFITEYQQPNERVLFDPVRDANCFFHFFESLWILDGRDDVKYLAQFNSNIASFSDNGTNFHAPYGWRLRKHFDDGWQTFDQLEHVIQLLRRQPDTRQAVLSIWDPAMDLGAASKDIPCNDLLFFKLRDGKLSLTVACRSNDALWGAYGANAVQFSVILEFVARAIGAEVGCYLQVSDSFHIYHEREDYQKFFQPRERPNNAYIDGDDLVSPHPIMHADTDWREWLIQLNFFTRDRLLEYRGDVDPFFTNVACPLREAWRSYKDVIRMPLKNERIDAAQDLIQVKCLASDWGKACIEWLERRRFKG